MASDLIVRYVDTDHGSDANGGSAWADAWRSMAHARLQFMSYGQNGNGDFTAVGPTYPGGIEGLLCCRGTTPDTTPVTWNPVTGPNNRMTIVGAGGYELSIADAAALTLSSNYITLRGLGVRLRSPSANRFIVSVQGIVAGSSDIRILDSRILGANNPAYYAVGIYVQHADAMVALNNLLLKDMGQNETSYAVAVSSAAGGLLRVRNATVVNAYRAINVGSNAMAICDARNVAAKDTTSCYAAYSPGLLELITCTSPDATAATHDDGGCQINVSPHLDAMGRLTPSDRIWVARGTDCSHDPYWLTGLRDGFGNPRPYGEPWDIGWHQLEHEPPEGVPERFGVLRGRLGRRDRLGLPRQRERINSSA